MSGPSRKNLDGAAAMFSKQSGFDQDRLRIAIHMLSALSLRLASHSPEELKWLTGARTEEDAHRRVERMLRVVAAAAAADLGMAEERERTE